MSVLSDKQFYHFCSILKLNNQVASDPDKKQIEKAFRKLALKTHPDKPGGNAFEFRRINDAYSRLLAHATKLAALDAEADLIHMTSSVIIEISKEAVPQWIDKLRLSYGKPKCINIRNPIFEGPFKQFKGRPNSTGPICIVLYEDPEDGVPKLHVRCENYTLWMREQNFPLHLHVKKDKKIRFDQWRIMSMAEFGFCKVHRGTSARHDWKFSPEKNEEEKEREERRRMEEIERRRREKEEEEERKRKEEEEERRKKEMEKRSEPWWMKHSGGGLTSWHLGEITPPPETDFPIYDPETNTYVYQDQDRCG